MDPEIQEYTRLRNLAGCHPGIALDTQIANMRAALVRAFAHLGKEIERKTLNESASDGTQELSKEIALILDGGLR